MKILYYGLLVVVLGYGATLVAAEEEARPYRTGKIGEIYGEGACSKLVSYKGDIWVERKNIFDGQPNWNPILYADKNFDEISASCGRGSQECLSLLKRCKEYVNLLLPETKGASCVKDDFCSWYATASGCTKDEVELKKRDACITEKTAEETRRRWRKEHPIRVWVSDFCVEHPKAIVGAVVGSALIVPALIAYKIVRAIKNKRVQAGKVD
jgi:hypothetical protein